MNLLTDVTKKQLKNVVSNDKFKPEMQGVFFDKEESQIVGTDGFKLVCYNVESSDSDVSALLPLDAFDISNIKRMLEAQTGTSKKIMDLYYKVTPEKTFVYPFPEAKEDLCLTFQNIQETFVDYKNAIPGQDEIQPISEIGIGVEKMYELMAAFPKGWDGPVKLSFVSKDRGILFQSRASDEACIHGLIMPKITDTV